MKRLRLFIDNEWKDSENGETFISVDPSKNEPIAELALATKEDVACAVKAASEAFRNETWSGLDGDQRAEIMLRAADIMRRRFKELASWEARDVGKPIREAEVVDIPYSIRALEYFANQAREIRGSVIPLPGDYAFDWTTYEPFGVVACVVP